MGQMQQEALDKRQCREDKTLAQFGEEAHFPVSMCAKLGAPAFLEVKTGYLAE